MQNLKINIRIKTPLLLDRLTSIDSILLATYYRYRKLKGKPITEIDDTHSTVDWIDRKEGVLSGSIWYIERNEPVHFDFSTLVKKPEPKKIKTFTGNAGSKAQFKQALITQELMIVKNIYFYIRGKKDVIFRLMQEVKNIGSVGRLNYGEVESFTIEEIEKDKSYTLNDSTPSKPLPVDSFNIDSKKVAFYRKTPPYWLEENLVACYMPTTSLYEIKDNSSKSIFTVAKDLNYVANVNFLYKKAHDKKIIKNAKFLERDFKEMFHTKSTPIEITNDNKEKKCVLSGEVSKVGYVGNILTAITKKRGGFAEFKYFKKGDFLSKEAFWCLDNIATLGFIYVDNKNWEYVRGNNPKTTKALPLFIKDLSMLKPPFSFSIKDTANQQHIAFKNRLSISNGCFNFQFGDENLLIDGEMLQNAVKDIDEITTKFKDITKTHLCRNFKDASEVYLKSSAKDKDFLYGVIMEFQKKYDNNIRKMLGNISLA